MYLSLVSLWFIFLRCRRCRHADPLLREFATSSRTLNVRRHPGSAELAPEPRTRCRQRTWKEEAQQELRPLSRAPSEQSVREELRGFLNPGLDLEPGGRRKKRKEETREHFPPQAPTPLASSLERGSSVGPAYAWVHVYALGRARGCVRV